jgi:autotransporter-associated beta strand protein
MRKTLAFTLVLASLVLIAVLSLRRDAPSSPKNEVPGAPPPVAATAVESAQSQIQATAASPAAAGVPAAGPAATATPPPPPRKRAWDPGYLASLNNVARGDAIAFELVAGEVARGTVRHTEFRASQLIYVAGELTAPEPGRFFFQQQSGPGRAGDFAGVVEFPGSRRGFRLEPSGLNGASELVEMALEQVVCLAVPAPNTHAEGKCDCTGPACAQAVPPESDEIPPLDPSAHPTYPVPDYQDGIISLQSLPGATAVLYIDYRGGYTPTWGGITYARPSVNNTQIRDVWKRVAEDYMPFRINVTTDIKVYEAAPETSRQRVICTPTTTAAPGAGGVAYLNSWNWSGDTPCWSFYSTGKSAAEVISHEAGHTLTLGHDGRITPDEGYFGGHGSGATGWAPIMGVGYYQPVAQWSKGEYASANNTQDDLARIVGSNNSVAYRTDDTGLTLATARYLELFPGGSALGEGVIETSGDADAFRFSTTGGAVSLRANPAPGEWANLAIQATLHNAAGTLVASNNPQNQLWASISTTVPSGDYTFRVTGAGRNDPLTSGFTTYASLGYYSVTGTVANARLPSRFSIAENSPNGTAVGTVVANNPGGNPLTYAITAGNTSGAFALNSSGLLTVANSAVLNYETLAANTQLTVQYELFVNIVNTVNPSLTETNRRVVVQILDVNEAPVMTGFTNTVLAATRVGTAVGTVGATDPEAFSILTFSILSGDTNGLFAIGAQSGIITVASPIANARTGVYNLSVQATDNGASPASAVTNVRLTVLPNSTPFAPGLLGYSVFDSIGSSVLLSGLTNNSRFPTDPNWEKFIPSFEADPNRADNCGAVLRGYLIPPVSGSYTFWIAADDNCDLRLGSTTNPASSSVIAHISGGSSYSSPRQWTKYTTQMSTARTLVAGQAYYLEARMKEGGGDDHLAVAWRLPGTTQTNVIPALNVAPYPMNYLPKPAGFTANVRRGAFTGAAVGRVLVSDANPGDTHTFTILSGNSAGLFTVDNQGWVRVASEALLQGTATTGFSLVIRATDNGLPARFGTASVALTVVEPPVISPALVQREMFYNIGSGNAVTDLTGNAKYPGRADELVPLTSLEGAANVADNYGSRIRALLLPPVSGVYRFCVASDDSSQLRLSTSTNPAALSAIASVSGSTGQNEWTRYTSQTGQRSLVAGQAYYLEVLQKEGGGADHVSVGWVIPGSGVTNVIEGAYLQPVDINTAPQISAQSFKVFAAAPNGVPVGTITATDGPLDTLSFKLIAGNSNNIFALDPASGVLTVADNTLLASGAFTQAVLTVAAQDTGLGGLYPLTSSQAVITINLAGPNDPFVWTGGGANAQWSIAANWSGLTPLDGVPLRFGAPVQQTNVNDLASLTARWLHLTNGGFRLDGNALTLQLGLTNTGNNVLALPVALAGAQTWRNNSGTLTVAAPVTNAGFGLNLVANGDLRLEAPLAGVGGLTKSGSARLLMGGAHGYTGITSISAASGTTTALELIGTDDLDLGSSTLVLNGRMDLWNRNAAVGGLNGSGLIFANDGNRVLTVGANHAGGSFTGSLTNSTWASGVTLRLIKAGLGTQLFTGANAHSGGTTLRAGRISFSHGSALGTGPVVLGDAQTGTNNLTLLATAAVTLTNPILVSATAGGLVTLGTEVFSASAVNMQYGGLLTLERDVALQAGSDDRTTFANRITGTGNVVITSPTANRRVVLSRPSGAANDFAGDLTVGTNAWLQLGVSDNLGNRLVPDAAVVKLGPGSRLRLAPTGSGDSETLGALVSLVPSAGIVEMFAGTAFTLGIGGGDASGVHSGPIVNTAGSLALTKIGAGTQVLGGANNFSGVCQITSGALVAAGASALGSFAQGTVVSAGATLALSNNLVIGTEALTLNGAGVDGLGALRNDSGVNAFNGVVTCGGPVVIGALEGALTLGNTFNPAGHTPTFAVADGAALTVAQGWTGAGGRIKQGGGRLALNGVSTFAGPTTVNAGTLAFGPSGRLDGTAGLTLAAGSVLDASATSSGFTLGPTQWLQGNGTVWGTSLLQGTVRPGASVGTLTFATNTTLAGLTVMEISKTGATLTSDRLDCGGTLSLGGTLVVTNLGPDPLAAGDTFQLFTAAAYGAGSFTMLTLPALTGDLLWDTSRLAVDGTLRVVTPEPPTPPTLTLQPDANSLTLSWPADYFSYTLQGQTNAVGAGLTPLWLPVPGVSNNTFTIPRDPAAGSMFFRLVQP